MARCAYCNSLMLFGGVREGTLRFCNATCHTRGRVASAAGQIPADIVRKHAAQIQNGPCPRCKKENGPVDVHTAHRIYSALFMTSWASQPQISCRSCGLKSQAIGAASSLLLGWWGVPWGLIMTPVQIGKNIVGIVNYSPSSEPSPQLEQMVRLSLATQATQRATR
jgi:DNA-directed RNA polymerase subunit RPC12/RpoP